MPVRRAGKPYAGESPKTSSPLDEILALNLARVVAVRLGGVAIDRLLSRVYDRVTGAKQPASIDEVKAAVRDALREEGAPAAGLENALGGALGEVQRDLGRVGDRVEDLDRYARENLDEIKSLVGEELSARLRKESDRLIAEMRRDPRLDRIEGSSLTSSGSWRRREWRRR